MSTQTLKKIALLNLSMLQIAKSEAHEKGVISREVVELVLESENINIQIFREILRSVGNHPCQLSEYRVWGGNYRVDRAGRSILKKPHNFSGRFRCKCKCDEHGDMCECTCDGIVKMLFEYKWKTARAFIREPGIYRIEPSKTIKELL